MEKLKKVKKKGRIYKIIQSRTQTQDKIAKDIIKLHNCNDRYIHTYLYLVILV